MKLIDGIAISARDISRRKLRSILTIVAIAVGCMLLVSMQGLGDTITHTATKFVESFGNLNQVMVLPSKYDKNNITTSVGSDQQSMLPYTANKQLNPKEEDNSKPIYNSTLAEFAKIKNVESLSAYNAAKVSEIKIQGVEKTGSNAVVLGYAENYKYDGQAGTIVAGTDLKNDKDGMLIDESYLNDLGIKEYKGIIGKTITLTVEMPSMPGMPARKPLVIEGKIEGVYKKLNSYYPGNIITFDNVTRKIQAYYEGKNPDDIKLSYSMVTLDTNNQKVIPGIMTEVNNNLGYSTFSLGEVVGIASIFTGFIRGILDLAAIIVIAVASIGLINTMTMTVQEKKKWIGIMRSLGGTKGNIRVIFLVQSLILGVFGGILGGILAIISIFGVNQYLAYIGKSFVIQLTAGNVIFGFIVSALVALIAGIIPSGRAAKLDVVETINEE